jgi:hypothetical protein
MATTGVSKTTHAMEAANEDQSPQQVNLVKVKGAARASPTKKTQKEQIITTKRVPRSKSTTTQFDNLKDLIQKMGNPLYERPSKLQMFEEFFEDSNTHYVPDDNDLKFYKNIKENQ